MSAARFITTLPVRSEPVKPTKSTSSTSAPPVSPNPLTQSKTSGAPTSSFHARTSSMKQSGVISDGLTTTAAPAKSAGIASPAERISGKFQGLIRPTTGYGRATTFTFFTRISGMWGLGSSSAR